MEKNIFQLYVLYHILFRKLTEKNRFYRIEKSIICNNVSLRSVDNIYSMHFINEQVYLDIVSKKYNLPASVLSHQEQQNVINIFKYMGKKCIRVYFKMKR